MAAKVAVTVAAEDEGEKDDGVASEGESSRAGDGDSGADEEVAVAAGEALVAEVREWKRVRGGLWGLVRWEPDPVDGEFPLEWREERHLGIEPHPLASVPITAAAGVSASTHSAL